MKTSTLRVPAWTLAVATAVILVLLAQLVREHRISEAAQVQAVNFRQDRRDLLANLPRQVDLMMVGDSLIALAEWSELLGRPAANRGVSGETTTDLLGRLNQLPRAQISVLMIGANDVSARLSPLDVSQRTEAIVRGLTGRVYLMSLPPRTDGDFHREIAELNELNRAVCERAGCIWVDVGPTLSPYMPGSRDGLHLPYTAYLEWAEELKPLLPPLPPRPGLARLPCKDSGGSGGPNG